MKNEALEYAKKIIEAYESEIKANPDAVYHGFCQGTIFRKALKDIEKMEKDQVFYEKKELEDLLWLPCCHVSGMHDPCHFEERTYICKDQKAEALERLCKKLGINPKTKSDPNCGWCIDYPKHKKGEGLPMFSDKKKLDK